MGICASIYLYSCVIDYSIFDSHARNYLNLVVCRIFLIKHKVLTNDLFFIDPPVNNKSEYCNVNIDRVFNLNSMVFFFRFIWAGNIRKFFEIFRKRRGWKMSFVKFLTFYMQVKIFKSINNIKIKRVWVIKWTGFT